MSKGVLLFANNNEKIDYVKQAIFCAKRIKKYLRLNVTIVTDSADHMLEKYNFYTKYIDKIISVPKPNTEQKKKFYDGYSYADLTWHNLSRASCYSVTPYDQTLVMDTDFIVSSDKLLQCFSSNQDFLINNESLDLNSYRDTTAEKRVSDTTIPMYWATVFYFTKTEKTNLLFQLISYIKENWSYYRLLYNIAGKSFRNDYAFSIAMHIMAGHRTIEWPKVMPTLHMSTDRDLIIDIQGGKIQMLLENDKFDIPTCIWNSDIHVMNKFSLDRYIDKDFSNE